MLRWILCTSAALLALTFVSAAAPAQLPTRGLARKSQPVTYALSVTPHYVPLATSATLRFRATRLTGHHHAPLARAVITLDGRRTRTDRRGRARLRLRLARRAVLRARLQTGHRTVAEVFVAFG